GGVDEDVRGLGVQLVPATGAVAGERIAQRLVRVRTEPHRKGLTGAEADVHTSRPVAERLHQCTGSTSSVRTPPVERGCRKATRLPRIPTRGVSSIRPIPA